MNARQHVQRLPKMMRLLFLSSMMVYSLSGVPTQAATASYADVNQDHWAYASIADLTDKGIASGYDDQFYPEANISRAEFVKLLVKALNLPLVTDTTSRFADVPTNQWYFPYIQTVFRANIAHGVQGDRFDPNAPISRQDMLVMLVNALHLQNIPSDLLNAMLPFHDAGSIRDYAKQAIALGRELQLVSGNPQGDFQPATSTSRAQAASVLDRMLYLPPDRLTALADPAFHPTTHLAVTVSPSDKVIAGQQSQVEISIVDGNNQQKALASPVPVTLIVSDSRYGTLSDQLLTIPAGGTASTTFRAGTQSGNVTINVAPAASALATTLSGSAKVTVFSQSAPKLVSGKGMWLMWSDWHNNNVDQLISKAKANHVSHLYMEVATSWHGQGFYGADALDSLLPKAHAAGIKVIGWTYDSLQNPASEAAVDIRVAQYRTPSGDMVDGLSPDIEETGNVTQASVTTYSQALRSALGPSYPLILCTYPPSWRAGFPWVTFGQYYDVIAPMDYWHYYSDKTYTYKMAYDEVSQTIMQIRRATGRPYIPITLIGQGYDMFSDGGKNSPSVDEIHGSMDAAKQYGAVGYSLYRWGTMTSGEWQAFGSYAW